MIRVSFVNQESKSLIMTRKCMDEKHMKHSRSIQEVYLPNRVALQACTQRLLLLSVLNLLRTRQAPHLSVVPNKRMETCKAAGGMG